MESYEAVNALSALAQDARLAIFRLLVEAGPGGLPVGDIGTALAIPAATLSFHLDQLKHADLVTFQRKGRQLIHAANYTRMNALLGYLTENCCGSDKDLCGPVPTKCTPAARKMPKRPKRKRT